MFVPRIGQAYANTTDFVENLTVGLDVTLVAAGWDRTTKGETISAVSGSTDRVYWSGGENGRESIFLRVTQAGQNIDFRAYSFWDTVAHAGTHVIGDAAGATRTTLQAGALVAWLLVDKNGIGLAPRVAVGTYQGKLRAGILERHVVAQRSGQTVISNATFGAASGQALVKVADTTNLQVGQDVWLINQKAGANNGNAERCTIQAINPGTRVIQMLANLGSTYDDGALVGADPQPMLIWASTAGNTEALVASTNLYMHYNSDAFVAAPGAIFLSRTDIEAQGLATFNPDDYGCFDVEDFMIYQSAGGKLWRRGYVSRFARVETGAFTDEDLGIQGTDQYLLTKELDNTILATRLTA